MATNPIIFIAVLIITQQMPVLEATEEIIHWHNGQRPQQVYLLPPPIDLTLHQSAGNQQAIAPLQTSLPAGKTITPLDRDGPWFSDLPGGRGRIRTLPGGLLVKFKKVPTPAELDRWAQEQQVIMVKPLAGQQTFLVQSPPGLGTLELATRLAAHPLVARVTPNWKSRVQLR